MSVLRNEFTDRIDKQIAYCEEHNLKILDITLTEGYILQLQESFDMYGKKPLLSKYMGIPVCMTEVPEVVYVRAIRDTPLDRLRGRCYIRGNMVDESCACQVRPTDEVFYEGPCWSVFRPFIPIYARPGRELVHLKCLTHDRQIMVLREKETQRGVSTA